jgi:GSH-dependent disulfide-bond oxidoreductase
MQTEHDLIDWLWATPNSNRVSILFEELGLAYRAIGVNIRKREQFDPAILAMNPYGKIPFVAWRKTAAADAPGHVLFESGAILIAFAERHGQLLTASGPARDQALAWLMVAPPRSISMATGSKSKAWVISTWPSCRWSIIEVPTSPP